MKTSAEVANISNAASPNQCSLLHSRKMERKERNVRGLIAAKGRNNDSELPPAVPMIYGGRRKHENSVTVLTTMRRIAEAAKSLLSLLHLSRIVLMLIIISQSLWNGSPVAVSAAPPSPPDMQLSPTFRRKKRKGTITVELEGHGGGYRERGLMGGGSGNSSQPTSSVGSGHGRGHGQGVSRFSPMRFFPTLAHPVRWKERREQELGDDVVVSSEQTGNGKDGGGGAKGSIVTPRTSHYVPGTEDHKDENGGERITMKIDLSSLVRFSSILFGASSNVFAAVMGTLRLLAPLIVARRILVSMANFVGDYLRGRYFRKTYTRLERVYLRYYEGPAVLRAVARTASQVTIQNILCKIMGWMVGITHPPCRGGDDRGLASFCGLLWIIAVCGLGHMCSTAVAVWGGPLRVQSDAITSSSSTTSIMNDRRSRYPPWHVLRLVQDPGSCVMDILTSSVGGVKLRRRRLMVVTRTNGNGHGNNGNGSSQSSINKKEEFISTQNPLVFPITWAPLRLLQFFLVARILSTEPCNYTWKVAPAQQSWRNYDRVGRLMRQFLLQQTLADEWCRVFLGEGRVGLGIFVVLFYFIALVDFVISSAKMNATVTVLMSPSVVALVVSAYLNVVIFWDRLEERRKEETLIAISQKKHALINAITVKPPLY